MTQSTSIFQFRRGFNLVEVMFAVITLGIGLIMVAAMFPVAIQQTKLTTEEGTAASLAWQGMNTMTQLGQVTSALPVTGVAGARTGVVTRLAVPNSIWKAVNGNMILPSDNRYAWVPLYRRSGDPSANQTTWDSTAQIILIGVKVRNASTFVANDVADSAAANLYPRSVNVTIADVPSGTDTVTFNSGATGAVAEGCYVIIAKDNIPGSNANRMNGRIYRVGNNISGNQWELMPGGDFNIDPGPDGDPSTTADNVTSIGTGGAMGTGADAFIIGRGSNGGGYEGSAMDISVYTGFVYAK